jgi:hypothetical protein
VLKESDIAYAELQFAKRVVSFLEEELEVLYYKLEDSKKRQSSVAFLHQVGYGEAHQVLSARASGYEKQGQKFEGVFQAEERSMDLCVDA